MVYRRSTGTNMLELRLVHYILLRDTSQPEVIVFSMGSGLVAT